MEQNLSNLIRPMSVVAQEAINYISGRRDHSITSLKTRWAKFNKQCMGGIEPNTVYTIAGISGSGNESFMSCNQTHPFIRFTKTVLCIQSVNVKDIQNIAVYTWKSMDYNWANTVNSGKRIPW